MNRKILKIKKVREANYLLEQRHLLREQPSTPPAPAAPSSPTPVAPSSPTPVASVTTPVGSTDTGDIVKKVQERIDELEDKVPACSSLPKSTTELVELKYKEKVYKYSAPKDKNAFPTVCLES